MLTESYMTERRVNLFNVIVEYIGRVGWAPHYSDLMAATGLNRNRLHSDLHALREWKWIDFEDHNVGTIHITRVTEQIVVRERN